MATFGNYPEKYLLFNAQRSKNLALILEIEDVPDLYGIATTYTTIRYGDPNIVYGLPGVVYGGLRPIGNVKPYIKLDTSLVIGQRIEPESGKGNIGTITLCLIDKNGEISKLITPGIVVDEILFNKQVRLWLGFTQTSYPTDYLLIFQGFFTQVTCPPGVVNFQISDSMSKKRQAICDQPTSVTTSPIDETQLTIPILSTVDFYQTILDGNGNSDPTVSLYIRVDDEIMIYNNSGIYPNQIIVIARGVLGSLAVAHDVAATVSNSVQIGDLITGINCIDMALKIQLSGWGGPCDTNIALASFVFTFSSGFATNAFVLANQDAIRDLGLSIGDFFTVSGASNSGNNISGVVTGFADFTFGNQIIYTDQTFVLENPTTAVIAIRSQYDTLPIACGVQMKMRDVDVATYQYIRKTYFSSSTSNVSFYLDEAVMGKDLVDSQLMLPFGCYSISRFGRSSMSVTKPPLPGSGKLLQLDYTNVLDPDKITVTRSTNSRSFYNVISFSYDKDPVTGNYGYEQQFLDTDSLNLFGDQVSTLPIMADGLRQVLGGAVIANSRSKALLTRYKLCVLIVDITVNWSVGSLIEVSDIVMLVDNGNLKIMNFETGERNLGVQLFEVTDRSYNIVAGNVKLKLMGGLGFSLSSRYGLVSPSSKLTTGSTSSLLKLTPSYGQTTIILELAKWTHYVGLGIQVHSADWSVVGTTFIAGIGNVDPTALTVDPPLGFTPGVGYIVDIVPYPTDTNKQEDAQYKLLYAHITPSIPITSGVSTTQFNVSLSDADKMTVGNSVTVRNPDYSNLSDFIAVSSIVGTLVTLAKPLLFTPDDTYFVEGIGFKDGTASYIYD